MVEKQILNHDLISRPHCYVSVWLHVMLCCILRLLFCYCYCCYYCYFFRSFIVLNLKTRGSCSGNRSRSGGVGFLLTFGMGWNGVEIKKHCNRSSCLKWLLICLTVIFIFMFMFLLLLKLLLIVLLCFNDLISTTIALIPENILLCYNSILIYFYSGI